MPQWDSFYPCQERCSEPDLVEAESSWRPYCRDVEVTPAKVIRRRTARARRTAFTARNVCDTEVPAPR